MTDLMQEMKEKRKALLVAVGKMSLMGEKLSESEYRYKIALRKEIFYLHEEKKVAWTACISLAHGENTKFEVAKKRYNRDFAKTQYESSQELINALKLEIRIIEGDLKREWGM